MSSGSRYEPFYMTIYCDNCHKTNKGHYSSFWLDGKIVTLCNDCRFGPRPAKSPDKAFDDLQTPFWKMMGQKPKPKDVALEQYLHRRGMTYGEWRREREVGLAKNPSVLNKFEEHWKKYGKNNAPDVQFHKNG